MLCGHQAIVRELDNTTPTYGQKFEQACRVRRAEPFDKVDWAAIGLGQDPLSSENTLKNSSAPTPVYHMQ